MKETAKLRIGFLIDDFVIPSWYYRMIEIIDRGDFGEIVVVVKNEAHPPHKGIFTRLWSNRNHQLYLLHKWWEQKSINLQPDAFEKKDIRDLLSEIPEVHVSPQQKKYSDYFSPADIERIKKFNVDIFIRMGFRILKGGILTIPKFGIWSYHHGDNNSLRGGPAGVWEVIENRPVTGAILQILTEDLDNGIILHRSFAATDNLSIRRNRNNLFWKNMTLLPNKLKELHKKGEKVFFERVNEENIGLNFYSNPLYRVPKNSVYFRFLFRLLIRKVKHRLRLLFYIKEWFLIFRTGPSIATSLWRYKNLYPPRDKSWADPFVIKNNGAFYLFFEEYLRKKGKGHISYFALEYKNKSPQPKIIIEKPYHLSYPFLFEYEQTSYILLSNSKDRTLELYKCVEFPDKWIFHGTMMEGIEGYDATLVHHNGKWWMFVNMRETEGASSWDSLHLYFADHPLENNWTPHPENPVVSDVRRARPAGRIFSKDGVLYRPAQDCSDGYGFGIRLQRIDCLDEDVYREHEVTGIFPYGDNKIKGVHTINHVEGLTVADAKRYRFSLFQKD